MSGRGKVFSYVVVSPRLSSRLCRRGALCVALIELAEGPRMISNVIGIAPEKVECDMRVEVAYQPISEKITLPKFKPIA